MHFTIILQFYINIAQIPPFYNIIVHQIKSSHTVVFDERGNQSIRGNKLLFSWKGRE